MGEVTRPALDKRESGEDERLWVYCREHEQLLAGKLKAEHQQQTRVVGIRKVRS